MPQKHREFGKYIHGKRLKAKRSLRDVAKVMGVSHAYLAQVEAGDRGPLRATHWPDLVEAIPGVTLAELERHAAETRPLEIDLSGAAPHLADLALAVARRLRSADLDVAGAAAILELLDATGGASRTVRAHGRVVNARGRPVSGTAFFYRLSSSSGWSALLGAREHEGHVAGPLIARLARETGKSVAVLMSGDKRGAGFFDLPGGLPPGDYALDVHHDGRQDWAWPLVVIDGSAAQDVPIGGPAAG